MSETTDSWPAGATFMFHINVANEVAAGASDIELIYSPGEGNEFEVLYGTIINADTVARATQVLIDTGTSGENLAILLTTLSTGAGSARGFPSMTRVAANSVWDEAYSTRWLVSG